VHLELPVLQRAAERRLQLQTGDRFDTHLGVEDHVRALALRLGRVHGDVGVAQQVVGILVAGSPDGDSDAGTHHQLLVIDLERLGQRGVKAFGNLGR
jgi:hypothetical protein